jgi:hypothetical protein
VDNNKFRDLNLWPGDRIFMRWLDAPRFFSAKFVYTAGELTKYEVLFYTHAHGEATKIESEQAEFNPALAPNPMPAPDERLESAPLAFQPVYRPEDDTYCWLCGGTVEKRHCKIICLSCGFTRDCSDP